jgi:NADPH2:quinone reductase
MKAAWYEKQGPARDVLTVGEMPDPTPASGEVRIRITASGISPGDVRNAKIRLATACLTLASSRTVMEPDM